MLHQANLPPKLMAPVSALLVMLRKFAAAALLVRAQVDALDFTGVPFGFVNQDVEFAGKHPLSNIWCDRPMAVLMAITSRENSDNSMPA